MTKRVLIFSLAYYPHVGGAEVAIKEITDRITSSDIEFHMITQRFSPSDKAQEKIGNILVHRVGRGRSYLSKILFVPNAALAALQLHKKEQFDAAWAMMSYMVFPLVLMRMLGTRIPYALTLQDGDPFERVFKRWYIRPLSPLLTSGFRNAAIVSVLSNYLAGWVRSVGYKGEVVLVPNGADTARFAASSPKDIGKKEGELWLVTSSRLVHKNAVDDIIRALALLPKHVHFLILGTGPDEHMLRMLVKECGVDGRVVFKGYVSHAELPAYLHACDIFVRPSRTEGFGASFPEAMAALLPVIATQEGGIADFLFDSKRNPDKEPTGFAVDKNSPEQIARAVEYILANPSEVDIVVKNAQKLAMEKYDWSLVAEDMKTKVFGRIIKI